jgi:hypothetical protein
MGMFDAGTLPYFYKVVAMIMPLRYEPSFETGHRQAEHM